MAEALFGEEEPTQAGKRRSTRKRRPRKGELKESAAGLSPKKTKGDSGSGDIGANPLKGEGEESKCHDRVAVCSLKSCSCRISLHSEQHVEIQAGLPQGNFEIFLKTSAINWSKKGEATFHETCWKEVAKRSRIRRNPVQSPIQMTLEEKALVKEASKTAEFHDSLEQLEAAAIKVAQLLKKSKHCIVFTGAGISTSAGIGDYRGKGGKWTEMDRKAATTMVAGSLQEEVQDREDEDEGVPYEKLRPTYTHEALVKLLEMGIVKHVISQNGDGLHVLSGVPPENISELHGNVFIEVCEDCGHRYNRPYYVMNDHASLYYEELADHGSTDIVKPEHAVQCVQCGLSHRTGRRCEQKGCRGFLKDSIINFGDDLEEAILTNAERHAEKADLCLSLGTTMQVTPACDLIEMGQKPLRLVVVNRQKTVFDELCYRQSPGSSGEQLGVRAFGDCDCVMRGVMLALLGEEEREKWEEGRGDRMKVYDGLRQSN